ncbi:hypothetical protein [Streptomyces sp. NPDC007369]|uniref:hypothetical protein n=1 Tax=Streptomyces sp. NPDC007369 TaxID=3154589 RepID=UPI0033E3415A
MRTAVLAATLLLALGLAWQALRVQADLRTMARSGPGGRVYRPGRGWTPQAALPGRRRTARARLAAAAALAGVTLWVHAVPDPGPSVAVALTLVSAAVLVVLIAGRRHEGGRYTWVCLVLLAGVLTVSAVAWAVTGRMRPAAAGPPASFFAAHLYLVAGIRKLRSPHFMNGGVLMDNLAYNASQALAGNREFPRWPGGPASLAGLLTSPAVRRGCRAAAVATAAGELLLGLGALGLLPAPLTLALAVPLHTAFLLVSPLRILPFTAGALGLLCLATAQPLLTPFHGG